MLEEDLSQHDRREALGIFGKYALTAFLPQKEDHRKKIVEMKLPEEEYA